MSLDTGTGLGDQATVAKIDKLRELNVGASIPLPQLVVVGDQSSGKSSVLESLTGFSFPRAAGLCTRYATQITCRRASEKSVVISIIPGPDADDATKARLQKFERRVENINNKGLAKVFEDANKAMGIQMGQTDTGADLRAFSEDILKVEISGSDQDHLTVIDVPGIFRVATPGLTTDDDIKLVENIVKKYIQNSRTIILAVMPCNVDIATQEILKLAETADPTGVRTMGVLTKPDLATEMATRNAVIDLVMGKGTSVKLGYYVVKNRGADETDSAASDRASAERVFFSDPAWSGIAERCGVGPLKARLMELLTRISNKEFPNVKAEIQKRLSQQRENLDLMGPARADESAQRLYLSKQTSRFQAITQAALDGYYTRDVIFKSEPELKLMTKIIKLNEAFSNTFWKRAHKQQFGPGSNDDGETSFGGDLDDIRSTVPPLDKYLELSDIICTEPYVCPKPDDDPILDRIQEVYAENRGPELGTFGGTILATMFEEQSEKWEDLVLSHASQAVVLVHDYIFRLLTKLCPEKQVRDRIWDGLLVDKLRDIYRRTMAHARFLLHMERSGRPSTFNHYFNSTLQKKRADRQYESLSKCAVNLSDYGDMDYVSLDRIKSQSVDKSNGEHVCDDILDCLVSYYKVARKRFVDVVCQQVVSHFLLEGGDSPLRVLESELFVGLTPERLEEFAGEDARTKRQRETLMREIGRLEGALKVLRV